ncbi:MAG TPA: transcription antitermination factor NusB [Verrucomicrobiales bacterium]|nr:transcription antitermination factor NusB [Verrucomicrobiales bacterium]
MVAGLPNSRLCAWQVLRRWSPEGTFAEDMVERMAVQQQLSGPNRSLLNAIVLAVLRNRTLLDAWIHFLRDGASLEDDVREWLRIGLVQLHLMGLPEHAAVNETVALAGRARGLVNAVLRRSLREKMELQQLRREAPPHVRHSLPEFLVQDWTQAHGTEAVEKLGEWCNTPAPVYVRVNGLHKRASSAVADIPGAERFEGPVSGWYQVNEPPRAELAAGLCYAQDPSTGIAPLMLKVKPGQTVLDACAAPGGKTAILAEHMENQGILIASDSSAKRLERLRENMSRMGATVVETHVQDWEHHPEPASFRQRFGDGFDRILLDVPCSNTGVLRRRVDARWRLQPGFFPLIAVTQHALLMRMLGLLKPGGRLVYSTCSIEPRENIQLVRAVLKEAPGWQLLEDKLLLPHRDHVDGAYAALIERSV